MANPTASAPGERSADHLSLIEPGRWALWRDVGVRASGFPVRGLEVFGAGDGAERLREVARDPRFREAVTWQNRAALRNTIDRAAMDNDRDDATSRRRLEIIASYWQRYCAKNETIGFFGPMGWGHIVDGEDPIDQQPGRELLAQRTVRFEVWAIQVLADVLAEDPDVHRWIPPRRRPDRGPADLTDPEMAVYSACDGRRPPWEVGDASILHSLVDRGIVQWDLRVPLGPNPERDLRARLEQIGDDDVRFRALATLEQLESGRDTVARAAGDAVSLGRALDELDATFVRVTGREPQRAAGVTYGARSVCYEDCRRHLDLRIGDALRTGPRPSELGSASHVQEDPDRAPRRDHRRLCVC